MSDNISRQAAIDALRYAQHRFTVADEAGGMGTVKWSEHVIYFAAAERVLTELPSANAVQGWTPCSERLPQDDGDVIMTNNMGQVKVGYHSEGRWWFIKDDGYMTGVNDNANVILAWMPLPEPYKGGEPDD